MTPKKLVTIAVYCLLIALPIGLFINAQAQRNSSTRRSDESSATPKYRLSGPYTHNNLSIFLVHGKDLLPGKNFLTLQEALAQNKVRVYETKEVNELAIQNLSNQDVYVQSGDIVRGGDQDRMISIDFIVPPKSGRMPIAAFCVESGRWSRRGGEQSETFGSSNNSVATRDLKLAAKSAKSQEAVWANVSVAQQKLSKNVGAIVNSSASATSFELAVENAKVKETSAAYINTLDGIISNKPDVIGYVFAINGQVNSADVYASHALFMKLWPKLLKASAVEAIAELNQPVKAEPIAEETVGAFLVESEKPSAQPKDVTSRVRMLTREDDKNAFYETQDRSQKDAWVHRNYIRKQ
jgi:ARG/rhodanese/phosphatase superfamily protein